MLFSLSSIQSGSPTAILKCEHCKQIVNQVQRCHSLPFWFIEVPIPSIVTFHFVPPHIVRTIHCCPCSSRRLCCCWHSRHHRWSQSVKSERACQPRNLSLRRNSAHSRQHFGRTSGKGHPLGTRRDVPGVRCARTRHIMNTMAGMARVILKSAARSTNRRALRISERFVLLPCQVADRFFGLAVSLAVASVLQFRHHVEVATVVILFWSARLSKSW